MAPRPPGDTPAGGALLQDEYIVSDYVFAADQGFSIYFEPGLYSALRDPAPVNADWDVIAIQPDAVLPSDGFLDALALSTGAHWPTASSSRSSGWEAPGHGRNRSPSPSTSSTRPAA